MKPENLYIRQVINLSFPVWPSVCYYLPSTRPSSRFSRNWFPLLPELCLGVTWYNSLLYFVLSLWRKEGPAVVYSPMIGEDTISIIGGNLFFSNSLSQVHHVFIILELFFFNFVLLHMLHVHTYNSCVWTSTNVFL